MNCESPRCETGYLCPACRPGSGSGSGSSKRSLAIAWAYDVGPPPTTALAQTEAPAAPRRYGQYSPAVRRLLVHCAETGGYTSDDPITIHRGTIESAREKGLITVDESGSCALTPSGRSIVSWALPPVSAR